MPEFAQLVIFETNSIPQGYKALEDLAELGLEPLEFYPHAQGVRILLKAPKGFSKLLPAEAQTILVSLKVIKAILSQTENVLRKYLIVVETQNFAELIILANKFEKIESEILEIRSLRSNTQKNYGLFSVDKTESAMPLLSGYDHSILSASSAALKEFLGFK
jgi:hypothetical protein